jgi:H+/gluconate symporter-like permease
MGLNISEYWKGVIATGAISGICGSASSGAQLTMQYLGDYFVNSGCNLDVMHRLVANASITFDALPHATGCFLMLSYFGLNHKIAYKYIFILDVVVPVVLVAIFTAICTVMY